VIFAEIYIERRRQRSGNGAAIHGFDRNYADLRLMRAAFFLFRQKQSRTLVLTLFEANVRTTDRKREACMQVGFIGVGRMGTAMARNLLRAGHRVLAWDVSRDALDRIKRDGAAVAGSAREAFSGDAVISMLPNDAAMRATFIAGDVLPERGHAPIHVNMATASVACAGELAAAHAAKGVPYVSATVYGRPEMAAERNLNILAAGEPALIQKVQPLFDAMGKKTWHLGSDPRNSNIAKIAGNLMVACVLEAMGEAAALARAYKMDANMVLDVVVGSIFDVPIYRIYSKMIANERFEPPGFDLALGLKDAKLALDAGEAAHVPLPFASVLRDSYLDAMAHGDAGKDWSAIAKVAARRAALE
jgi:3-hydroxyisobutyrate dehydrogenase-like beta-hydroxyacid dehydrogenase